MVPVAGAAALPGVTIGGGDAPAVPSRGECLPLVLSYNTFLLFLIRALDW